MRAYDFDLSTATGVERGLLQAKEAQGRRQVELLKKKNAQVVERLRQKRRSRAT